jgi:2-hydroxy-3-oxopropionate reductase
VAKIGFIGLGIMRKPMAGHLINAGHTLYIYDVVEAPVLELRGQGAVVCKDSKEVAGNSEIVFLMLPDTPDVERALFAPDGVASGIRAGSIVVDMSSISPIATRGFAEKLAGLGVEMLDAPVSGGQVGAENGTLSIMVGGKPGVFEKIKPYFEKMGKNIVLIGGAGDGQVCKVANQIVVALTLEAVSEALVFASKAGADVAKVREALLGGFAQSKILEVHGERMIKRTFQPGFRIRLHQKDLNLALQAGRELGVSLPNSASTQQLFTAVAAEGGIDLDHSALVKAIEKMAGHAIGEGKAGK